MSSKMREAIAFLKDPLCISRNNEKETQQQCRECDVRDICGEVLSICSYCLHFEDNTDNCICLECDNDNCKFESRFKL